MKIEKQKHGARLYENQYFGKYQFVTICPECRHAFTNRELGADLCTSCGHDGSERVVARPIYEKSHWWSGGVLVGFIQKAERGEQ